MEDDRKDDLLLSTEHMENGLKRLREVFEYTKQRIDGLKHADDKNPAEKIPATKLTKEIVEHLGIDIDPVQLYPILREYFFKDHPNIEILRGAHGGIRQKKK